MGQRNLILVATALAILVAVALGAFSLYNEIAGSGAGGVADIGGPFSLIDQTGRRVSDTDFRGHYMLVYFGYTYCPDVCPTELATISRAIDLLGTDAARVTPIFITVDPARDTPKVLAEYHQNFHPSFVMLTGSADEIAAAAKAYRVYYAKAGEDDQDYLMDHSSFVYLMDEDGRYVTHFAPDTTPEAMAKSIRAAF